MGSSPQEDGHVGKSHPWEAMAKHWLLAEWIQVYMVLASVHPASPSPRYQEVLMGPQPWRREVGRCCCREMCRAQQGSLSQMSEQATAARLSLPSHGDSATV